MAATVGVRPNIRIEIQNNINEPMDVVTEETAQEADVEEGEINDTFETDLVQNVTAQSTNKSLPSTMHLNIGDQNMDADFLEHLNPLHLKPNDTNKFPEGEINKLLNSLGITSVTADSTRFDALHLQGIKNFDFGDICEYFAGFEPSFVEWINAECCNVVFQDNISAAKALYFTSKVIKGTGYPSDLETGQSGKSILLINKDRQVELENDEMVVLSNNDDDSVNVSDITVPIPEGHWRLGFEHAKAKFIFIRFSIKSDKKPLKLEYVNKITNVGSPEFGSMLGLISESRKKKIKGIFDRNKEINNKVDDNVKNPWGNLAENWYTNESIEQPPPVLNPVVKREVLQCEKFDVLNRLGTKRPIDTVNDESDDEAEGKKKIRLPRMRMYADEEEALVNRKKRLVALKQFTNVDEPKVVRDLRNIILAKIPHPMPASACYLNDDCLDDRRCKNELCINPFIEDKPCAIGAFCSVNKHEPVYARPIGYKGTPRIECIPRTATKTQDEPEESDYLSDPSDLGKKLKNRKDPNYRNSRSNPLHVGITDHLISSIKEESRLQTLRSERQQEERKTRENDRYIRERERQLDNFRNKSPPLPKPKHIETRHKKESTDRKTSLKRDYDKSKYKNKMHSDRYDNERHKRQRRSRSKYDNKTKSTVAVVLKKQKKPVVASTVWSRIDNTKKERLKTASERLKMTNKVNSESSHESSSDSSDTSSSSNSSSESSCETEDTNDDVVEQATQAILKTMDRPGFKTSNITSIPAQQYKKSPLRIEISNDHFKN